MENGFASPFPAQGCMGIPDTLWVDGGVGRGHPPPLLGGGSTFPDSPVPPGPLSLFLYFGAGFFLTSTRGSGPRAWGLVVGSGEAQYFFLKNPSDGPIFLAELSE